jgi:hypothetical protein
LQGYALNKSTPLNTHEYQYPMICNHQVASSKPAAGTSSSTKSPILRIGLFAFWAPVTAAPNQLNYPF